MKQKAIKRWVLPSLALCSLVLLLMATSAWADTYNAQVKFDRDYYTPYYNSPTLGFDCAHIGVRDVDWTIEPSEVVVHVSSDTDPTGMDFYLADTSAIDSDSFWATYGGLGGVETLIFPDDNVVGYDTVCAGEPGTYVGLRFSSLTSTEGDAPNDVWGELLVSNHDTIVVTYVDPVGANGQETTVSDSAIVTYWTGSVDTQPANLKYTNAQPASANLVLLITDHDLNLNPSAPDVITADGADCQPFGGPYDTFFKWDVNVQSDKAGCTFDFSDVTARTLVETGKNTGVFRAYGFIWDGAGACTQPVNPNRFYCEADINDDITFKYYDRNQASGAEGSDTIHVAFGQTVTGQLSLPDPPTFEIGDKLVVTVDDSDLNLNPNAADVWDWNDKAFAGTGNCVKIMRTGSRDGVKVTQNMFVPLIETGTNTGIFTGEVEFCCGETRETHGLFDWVGKGTNAASCLEGARNLTYTITYYDAADFYGNSVTKVAAASFLTRDGSIDFGDNILSQGQDVLVTLYDNDLNTNANTIQNTYDPGSLGTGNNGQTDTGITAAQDQNWADTNEHRPLSAPNTATCDSDCGYVMVLVTTYDGYIAGGGTNGVKADYETVVLNMRETANDSGIFTGWFQVSGTAGATFDAANGNADNDVLYVDGLDPNVTSPDHEVIYAYYVDSPASGNSLKLRTNTAATTTHVSTMNFFPGTPWYSDTVTVTLTDTDLDVDPSQADIVLPGEYATKGGVQLESQSTKVGPFFLYFKETGNNTGTFTGEFEVCSEAGCSQDGNAGVPAKIQTDVRNEVTLTLHDTNPDKEYEQKFLLPSHDGQMATNPFSGDEVSPNGDTIDITITEKDLDLSKDNDDTCEGNQPQDPPANCSVICSSDTDANGTDVKLEETGINTGVFTGYVQTCLAANCTQGGPPAKIQVAKDDVITVTYIDAFNAAGQQNLPLVAVFYAKYILGDLNWNSASYTLGENAVIKLDDRDRDTNPLSPQTQTVYATSSTDPAGITVTLLETANDSHMFEKSIIISSTTSVDNTALKAADGDTLTARYNDAKNNNGMYEVVYAYANVGGPNCPYEHTGDVDENGVIDPDDALSALLIYLDLYPETDCSYDNADVCPVDVGDGVVDPGDAVAILKIYLGISGYCD